MGRAFKCPFGPGDRDHGHRRLNRPEMLELSLQNLNRNVVAAFLDLEIVEVALEFIKIAVRWMTALLPPATVLHPMWTLVDGKPSRAFMENYRGRVHRYRMLNRGKNGVDRPEEARASPYFKPIPSYSSFTAEEYDHLWSTPQMSWNPARLAMFADGSRAPIEGRGYNHRSNYFPREPWVKFGPLMLDPVTYHEELALIYDHPLYPVLPNSVPVQVGVQPSQVDLQSTQVVPLSGLGNVPPIITIETSDSEGELLC